VAFGVPWFIVVAAAQLRLTELEDPWSVGFTLVAMGGGLAFVLAATLAGGTAPARGALTVDRERFRVRRMVIAALVLVGAGVIGAVYKASVLDGVPLFSGNADVVRGRAFRDGEGVIPAWSSALTGGFYLGLWCTLATLWLLPSDTSRVRRAALWLLAAAALLGVSLEASRNLVVYALVVPAGAAYLLARPRRPRVVAAWMAAAMAVVAVFIAGTFVLRLDQADGPGDRYVETQLDRQPLIVRPLVPLYINAVYPMEAARRVYGAVPDHYAYGLGADSLTSLPDKAFPEGKSPYGSKVAELMNEQEFEQVVWSVAGYQGRLLADLGWQGVMLGSLLLGLGFGYLHRWARTAGGLVPAAVIAGAAYYSAYMIYDNHLSFTLIAIFDVAMLTLISAFCTGWRGAPVRALERLVRRPAAA
jgi:hypothetical protein